MSRLRTAARTLVWLIVALVCAVVASVLGVTALIVSLWDTQRLATLVPPAIGFAVLAVLFGVVAARTLRTTAAVDGWIGALVSLLFLGGSRELLARALRLRAVLALIAHALHVLRLFSRRHAPRAP